MPVDETLSAQLLSEKADFEMPSAEGEGSYPSDLLEMSADQLRDLIGSETAANGNGSRNGSH